LASAEPKSGMICGDRETGSRKTETAGRLAAFVLLLAGALGLYLWVFHGKPKASLAFPVAAVLSGGVVVLLKAMRGRANGRGDGALNARCGAEEYEGAGTVLDALPKGFFVLRDFDVGREKIEGVVICRKGVLTVETESHRGIVTFDGEKLKRDGQPFEGDWCPRAWAHAFCVRDLLAQHGISFPKPQPVLFFPRAEVRVREKAKGVVVAGGKSFPACVERLPNHMNAKDAERIFELLKLSQARMLI
jgi:hypothetical protein